MNLLSLFVGLKPHAPSEKQEQGQRPRSQNRDLGHTAWTATEYGQIAMHSTMPADPSGSIIVHQLPVSNAPRSAPDQLPKTVFETAF